MLTENLNSSLRNARESAGYTIQELARESGVSAAHISMCEHGQRRLGWRAALRLAEILRIKPVEIL